MSYKWKHVFGHRGCYSEIHSQSAHLCRDVVGLVGASREKNFAGASRIFGKNKGTTKVVGSEFDWLPRTQ